MLTRKQEIDEALQSRMSPEEEEAVQAELEALQREAMVSLTITSHYWTLEIEPDDHSPLYLSSQRARGWNYRMSQSKNLPRQNQNQNPYQEGPKLRNQVSSYSWTKHIEGVLEFR